MHLFCIKKYELPYYHISSSYAKIWGETKFQPREFLRSGSKAIYIEREKKYESQWLQFSVYKRMNQKQLNLKAVTLKQFNHVTTPTLLFKLKDFKCFLIQYLVLWHPSLSWVNIANIRVRHGLSGSWPGFLYSYTAGRGWWQSGRVAEWQGGRVARQICCNIRVQLSVHQYVRQQTILIIDYLEYESY